MSFSCNATGVGIMVGKRFSLVARVDTDSPAAVRPILETLVPGGTIRAGSGAGEFLVEAEMDGESARDLNRSLLTALRKVEKRTRLRAEWTQGGFTERFFDYVSKGTHKAAS
jgi:hypothetical protein